MEAPHVSIEEPSVPGPDEERSLRARTSFVGRLKDPRTVRAAVLSCERGIPRSCMNAFQARRGVPATDLSVSNASLYLRMCSFAGPHQQAPPVRRKWHWVSGNVPINRCARL